MPVVLHSAGYRRWLMEPDPSDLMKPFPADPMIMWRIDRKVGNYKNDTPDILDPALPAGLFE
jgi:putative SOS response-associated peptidase YedK